MLGELKDRKGGELAGGGWGGGPCFKEEAVGSDETAVDENSLDGQTAESG